MRNHDMAIDTREFIVEEEYNGIRLDIFLAEHIEDASRSFLQKLIKSNQVMLNEQACKKPGRNVQTGEVVVICLPPSPPDEPVAEAISLDILYEDKFLIVVNKPPGMVVHPAPGHYTGTLVNALLHHCPEIRDVGEEIFRPGIVHRLDRDTSGVMVAAKTPHAFEHLAEQAASHTFDRRYLALIRGEFKEDRGSVDAGIGRSLTDRSRMAVTGVRSKEAVTHFEVLERFGIASLIALQLETGRTHQIRVHMRFVGRPVLGDPVYGVTELRGIAMSQKYRTALDSLTGQALHAEHLGLDHPETGERMSFSSPPPKDFQDLLEAFRLDNAN